MMFRPLVFLFCIIVAVKALNHNFSQGSREEGDIVLSTGETVTHSPFPEGSFSLAITLNFLGNEHITTTYASYHVVEVCYVLFAICTFPDFNY